MVLGLVIFNRKDKTFSVYPPFIFVVTYTVGTWIASADTVIGQNF